MIATLRSRVVRVVAVVMSLTLAPLFMAPARADEIWIAPTSQADLGGLEIASNTFWPVTPIGAVRMAWAVPNNLQTFQGAKIVLIPGSPGGAASVSVFVCAAQSGNSAAAGCAGPFAQPFTGVANQLVEVEIGPSIASRIGAPGANYLTVLAFTSPTTSTDHIVGMRFAYTPTAPSGAATLGANTFSGTQTAPQFNGAFVGNGSGLTNLPIPSGVATLGANTFSGTQTAPAFVGSGAGLTNLPFPAGAATLGANTFTATQTIDTGNLDLDDSTATTGSMTKNGVRFLHNFGFENTFLGASAGNVSTTGPGQNVAIGVSALAANTTGDSSTAIGSRALTQNTSGIGNTATGRQALASNTTGNINTANGYLALAANTTGERNTASGYFSLVSNSSGSENSAAGAHALRSNATGNRNTATGHGALENTTGSSNVGLGRQAGREATTGSFNIYLGADVLGVAGESNTMYLGKVGTQTTTLIAGVRGTVVSGGEAVLIDANGRLGSGPVTPGANSIGTNEVIDDSLTASDLGPNSVGSSELAPDSVTADKVAFNYAASASEGGAASDVACVGCVAASEVSFNFAGTGANTFTGTQTIDTGNLDLDPSSASAGNITKNGIRFLHDFGASNTFLGLNAGNVSMTGQGNTATGTTALVNNTSGSGNTAFGADALFANTTGAVNIAIGGTALSMNTTGSRNTAAGSGALSGNVSGSDNTASGFAALTRNDTGNRNTASGYQALFWNTAGVGNTASGADAMQNSTGSNNVAVGQQAGFNATTGSNNIYLGANVLGVAGESNTMYLGKVGTQTTTLIAGVRGTVVSGGEAVLIDANGRLGSGLVTPGANSIGTNEVINDSLTASDLAPDSVGSSELAADSVTAAKVAFNYAGSASEGGAAADLACIGCVSAGEVSFSFAGTGANTFAGTQTIDAGHLDLDNSTSTTGMITKNGTRFLHNIGSDNLFLGTNAGSLTMTGASNTGVGSNALANAGAGENNSAIGASALASNTAGGSNTAIGRAALQSNSTGSENTAVGASALTFNTANDNTAVGYLTLFSNTSGNTNAAVGPYALSANTTGNSNVAFGYGSLVHNTTGSTNVALGVGALELNQTGGSNTAVGFFAGGNSTTGAGNIYLGAQVAGVAGESNTMYLGKVGTQTKTVIAGIRGVTTGVADAIPVVIDSNGQLGTVSSSIRFKEDIHDMADASRRLLRLRPVTFRYTQPYINGAKPIQYGLIAEEVAEVFPELAVRGADGQVETVHYETLNVLLLNELQQQIRRNERQEQLNDEQQRRIETLERKLNALLDGR
jgi:hypothetical protein